MTGRWELTMSTKNKDLKKPRISQLLRKEKSGFSRVQKRTGVKKISFYYQYPDGKSETLATANVGDRNAIAQAERTAQRKALDIREGQIISGSVADMIERFKVDIAPNHYRDQSKDGLAVRQGTYDNLIKFFGKMSPTSLKTVHGYQFLDARAKAGAPAKANKELSMLSTICHYAVRWGVIEANPFVGMMQNKTEKDIRTISRSQIVRFYLWSLKQPQTFRNLGCAAMFTYLTGFRAAEVRPFHVSGLTSEGVKVINAKRKKGEQEIVKVREWSTRLRVVVTRAKQTHKVDRLYLFANLSGAPYSRSGWGSVWQDAMLSWVKSIDDKVEPKTLIEHPLYFSLLDVRPAAITAKLKSRSADAYDFAAHANPSTTHKNYDRRKEKKASATE
jgi:integrase